MECKTGKALIESNPAYKMKLSKIASKKETI